MTLTDLGLWFALSIGISALMFGVHWVYLIYSAIVLVCLTPAVVRWIRRARRPIRDAP